MVEAEEGHATLEDIHEQTFIRFSQYAYTGDYDAVDPDVPPDSFAIANTHTAHDNKAPLDQIPEDNTTIEPLPDADSESDATYTIDVRWRPSTSKKGRKGKGKKMGSEEEIVEAPGPLCQNRKTMSWVDFKEQQYATSQSVFQPRKNLEPYKDYTEVFLCHARIYVFADKYDTGPLRDLSSHKLQRTLAEFTLYDDRVGDIFGLMRYSYLNTFDRSEAIDDLRSLVIQYAACVIEELAPNVKFQSLLKEPGLLARDLINQMLGRLY